MDRNRCLPVRRGDPERSLSARRAWIEIGSVSDDTVGICVALRKESVDRNREAASRVFGAAESLSARRAWIEILDTLVTTHADLSLSARRAWIEIQIAPQAAPA